MGSDKIFMFDNPAAGYLAGYVGALFTKPIKDEICDCCKKKLK